MQSAQTAHGNALDAVLHHVGVAQATSAALRELRAGRISFLGKPVPKSLLRHADDQSVVAILALENALAGVPDSDDRDEWGLIGSPRRPGRNFMTTVVKRFAAEGAWSVSPHVVPHCSLHSLSGLLSMVLQVHGPNLGAGGVPGGESEALLAALTLLVGEQLPGVWLVYTGWLPEPEADRDGVCRAVALGLTQTTGSRRLRWTPARDDSASTFTLESLFDALQSNKASTCWALAGNGQVELLAGEKSWSKCG